MERSVIEVIACTFSGVALEIIRSHLPWRWPSHPPQSCKAHREGPETLLKYPPTLPPCSVRPLLFWRVLIIGQTCRSIGSILGIHQAWIGDARPLWSFPWANTTPSPAQCPRPIATTGPTLKPSDRRSSLSNSFRTCASGQIAGIEAGIDRRGARSPGREGRRYWDRNWVWVLGGWYYIQAQMTLPVQLL